MARNMTRNAAVVNTPVFGVNRQLTASNLQLQKYTNLDQKGNIIAEYIWIDAFGATRSKARVSQSPSSKPPVFHLGRRPNG